MKVHNSKKLLDRRKELRKFSTPEEEILWMELRNNKLGTRFRRQHSIVGYILDIYCFKARLIIELDGKSHDFQKDYDIDRDRFFKQLNYQTLRIKNSEVQKDLNKVLNKKIRPLLTSRRGRRSRVR